MTPFIDLFDGYYDDDIYLHTPNHFLPQLKDPGSLEALRKMEMVFAVGHEDPFLQSTRELSQSLTGKGIGHHFAVWEGEAHRARYWRKMVQLYL